MSRRRKFVLAVMVLALAPWLIAGFAGSRGQDASRPSVEAAAAKPPAAESTPAPRPPKERMGVSVMLAWIWFTIAVLFWLIRLRVREADRVFHMGLQPQAGKKPGDEGR